MSGYLKLPAYGRALLDARDLGRHPSQIIVWYGDRWWERPRTATCVCVGIDYTHGIYDWSVVAGVPVQILWRAGRRIKRLVAEVAAQSPLVSVLTPRGNNHGPDSIFFRRPGYRRHPLWSLAAEKDYPGRRAEFYSALLVDIAGEVAHG